MPVPAGTWARIDFYYSGEEKIWSNSYWYTSISAFPPTWDQATAASTFYGAFSSALAGALANNLNLIGLNLTVHNGTNSYGLKLYQTTPGTAGSVALPEELAAIVQRLSDTAGKSGRGRFYFSGLSNDLVIGSYLSAAGVTAMLAIKNILTNAINDQTMVWSPAVHSRKTNALHALVSASVINLMGTARRRRSRF
jgi:hypothetical protein